MSGRGPLPGAPDPWTASAVPVRRAGPPFHMTDMIEAEPALARRILDRLADPAGPAARLAGAVREAAESGRPILVTGCGTSEHAATALAELLRHGLRAIGLPGATGACGVPTAVQAFEASLEGFEAASEGGLVIGVSHEGGTWATNLALEGARVAGARSALVTISDRSPAAALVDLVVTTDEQDQSWCHTVGYLSPILAGLAVVAHLTGRPVSPDAAADLLAAGLSPSAVAATEAAAAALAGVARLVVVGSGVDRAAARELVLKVEEGAHLPAAMRDLETFLHGHLAGTDDATGLVLVLAEPSRAADRGARATGLLRAAREVGIVTAAILGSAYGPLLEPALTPAGRLVGPPAPDLSPVGAALLTTAVPLQLLAERLARVRGVDPDPIRRDDPAYLRAAEVAG